MVLGEKCGKYGIQYYITVGKQVLYNNNYNISRIYSIKRKQPNTYAIYIFKMKNTDTLF